MLPEQYSPSPEYPSRQVHVKLPGVLVQLASGLHAPLLIAHSSISVLNNTSRYISLLLMGIYFGDKIT